MDSKLLKFGMGIIIALLIINAVINFQLLSLSKNPKELTKENSNNDQLIVNTIRSELNNYRLVPVDKDGIIKVNVVNESPIDINIKHIGDYLQVGPTLKVKSGGF